MAEGDTFTSTTGGGGGFGSQSSGESQSTSEPTSVESRQTDWGLLQSRLLSMLGEQQYNWAMQQYAKGEGVSDQTIANFLDMSGRGKGLADLLMTQYRDQMVPLMNQYIQDAGTYASEERQRFEAGQAMSGVAQADTAAINEMERKLGSMGINPNSGRYQDMMLSSRVADAAARAGAGTKAAQDTADRGRAMEERAIAMGQQIPGQAVNAINSAYAGLTGAENSILGLLNTGASLAQSAAPFYNAAVSANKIPPTGQVSQQTSQQKASSVTPGPTPGGGGGGSGGGKQPAGEKQPAGQKQPQAGGGGKGEGDGSGGGGKGPGGAGSADSKATVGYGADFGKAYTNIPQTSRKKDEGDPGAGTGEMPSNYTGITPYFDTSGSLLPQWSPDMARTPEGDLQTPQTAQWDGPQAANWTPPIESTGSGFNVAPGVETGNVPGLPGGAQWQPDFGSRSNLGAGWPDQPSWGGGSDTTTTNTINGPQDVSGSGEMWGGWGDTGPQDISGSGEMWGGWGDTGPQDISGSGEMWGGGGDTGTDWTGGGAGGVDESGFTNTNWDNSGAGGGDGGGADDYSQYNSNDYYSGAADTYGGQYDVGGGGGYDDSGYSGSDYNFSDGSYGGGYEEYARGGPVRPRPMGAKSPPGIARGIVPMQGQRSNPTTGGPVPRNASPSQGRQTDDISARLNAGEYVIPRDVVAHKGTEFFTKMIQNSRKLRTGMAGATPQGRPKPPLPGRPMFRSRPMGGGPLPPR